jgi:hypothetical protein
LRDLGVIVIIALLILCIGYGLKYIVVFKQLPVQPSALFFVSSLLFVLSSTILQRYREMEPKESIMGAALLTLILVLLFILLYGGLAYLWVVYEVAVNNPSYVELSQNYGLDKAMTTRNSFLSLFAFSMVISSIIYTFLTYKFR